MKPGSNSIKTGKSSAIHKNLFCPDAGNKKELQHWVRQLWSRWISEVQYSKQLEKENRKLKLLCKQYKSELIK